MFELCSNVLTVHSNGFLTSFEAVVLYLKRTCRNIEELGRGMVHVGSEDE